MPRCQNGVRGDMIHLKLFASLAEEAGRERWEVPFQPTPRHLVAATKELAFLCHHPVVHVAVNQAWGEWDQPLKPGDEVGFMPPVCGD